MATTKTPGTPSDPNTAERKSGAAYARAPTPPTAPSDGGDRRASAADAPAVDRSKTEVVCETRWLRLETVFYRGGCRPPPPPPLSSGDDVPDTAAETAAKEPLRPWDRVVRTTKATEESIDAVAILAILRDSERSDDRIVLVRQYRPAVDSFTLEVPAGLIDDGETPVEAAIREFREETGYVGEAMVGDDEEDAILPLPLSPGLTNECVTVVRLDVDMGRSENRHPIPASDGCEEARGLKVVLLPLEGLGRELRRMHAEEGVLIFGMLYSFAMALELRRPRTGGAPTDLVWLE